LRILHLINDLSYAGAQRVIFNLVKAIDRNRFEPLVAVWGGPKEFVSHFEAINIKVIDLNAYGTIDIGAILRLYKFLRKNNIDVLHTHLFRMHIIGRLVGRLANVQYIVTTHHNMLESNHKVTRLLERVTRRLSDITTAVSRAAEESYFPSSALFSKKGLLAGRKHFTIYNAIDIDEIDGAKEISVPWQKRAELGLGEEFIFVCVARLHPCKGHEYLLDAVNKLRQTHPFMRLILVGEGPIHAKLVQEVQIRGIDKYVLFCGVRNDIYEILHASNALVLPSVYEGFGIAIAEAMAVGLPVIATNLDTISEIVKNGETGLLVPPRNANKLAKAMAYIMDNPETAGRYGHNGRNRVDKLFSIKDIARQYEALYYALEHLPSMV